MSYAKAKHRFIDNTNSVNPEEKPYSVEPQHRTRLTD